MPAVINSRLARRDRVGTLESIWQEFMRDAKDRPHFIPISIMDFVSDSGDET